MSTSRARLRWWLIVLASAALAAILHWAFRPPGPADPDDYDWAAVWQPREFLGVVFADGEPLAGATVELYEEAASGDRQTTVTEGDGGFALTWVPRTTTRLENVFLRAFDDDESHAPTIVPVRESGNIIDLVRRVACRGRIVDLGGEPVEGVDVAIAQAHGPDARTFRSGADGTFFAPDMPEGASLDVLVSGEGILPELERRFRGGDELTLHVRRGHTMRLDVRDPTGAPVAGARALPALLPPAFQTIAPQGVTDAAGIIVLPHLSSGGARFVEVDAPGHLPVQLAAKPHETRRVVLWPERVVELQVVDAQRKRGVTGLEIEVQPEPEGGTVPWTGESVGSTIREYPRHRGRRAGAYILRLPDCRVRLRLSSPGYSDAEVLLPREVERVRQRMVPLPRQLGGVLELDAPGAPDGFPLLVADQTGRWHSLVRLSLGRAEVEVPPDQKLQIGSPVASDGYWYARQNVDAPPRGRRKVVRIRLSRAVRLTVSVEPEVNGEVRLVDVAHRQFTSPVRAALEWGRAVFWVRPQRKVGIEVLPDGNYFPISTETRTEERDYTWTANLKAAAGLRYRLRDRGGNAVPFAEGRLWEPGFGGRLDLRRRSRAEEADATGELLILGLRGGEAALQVRLDGFRTMRKAPLRLEEGRIAEGGTLTIEPARRLRGRVLDPDGKPVPGVWVRVLEPAIARLAAPSGVELDLYDLTAHADGDVATDAEGRFEVRDTAPRAPLIALYPTDRHDLAPAAFLPPPDGGDLVLTGAAYVEMDVPGSVAGVYETLKGGKAVLVKTDPPMSLRPLPILLNAGRVNLFVRLRNGKWAAPSLTLERGKTVQLKPTFR